MTGREICDDGDTSDVSKCNSSCLGNVQGWSCVGGSLYSSSSCNEICGDGFRVGSETCDDGLDDGFGCATGCKSGNSQLWSCHNADNNP